MQCPPPGLASRAVSIRTNSLASLDNSGVRDLINEGETLFVERKVAVPSGGLGATVASFANTLGGWLLLGVADDGALVGFTDHGRSDLQDHLRHVLRNDVDPLPPFAARTFQLDGTTIGVVRIYESVDTPHIVRRTGALYIREPGGKAPVKDHATLIELARRGERARALAEQRLRVLPHVEGALRTPERVWGDEPGRADLPPLLEVIVAASPLTVGSVFADLALASDAMQWAWDASKAFFESEGQALGPERQSVQVEVMQRGFTATGNRGGSNVTTTIVVDSGGALGARFAWRRTGGAMSLRSLVDDELRPLIGTVAGGLDVLGGHGRAVAELRMRGIENMMLDEQPGHTGLFGEDLDEIHVGGALAVPATPGDVTQLASRWAREVGRAAGLMLWEDAGDFGAA